MLDNSYIYRISIESLGKKLVSCDVLCDTGPTEREKQEWRSVHKSQ